MTATVKDTDAHPHPAQCSRADRGAMYLYGVAIACAVALSPVAYRIFGWAPPVLGLLGTILYIIGARRFYKIDWPLTAVLAAVCLLGGLSVLWSTVPDLSLEQALATPPLLLGGWLLVHAVCVMRETLRAKLASVFLYAYLAGLVLAFVELLSGLPLYHLLRDIPLTRNVGLSVLNHTAVILSVLLWPAAYISWRQFHSRILTGLLVCAGGGVCFVSASETSMLAVWGGLAMLGAGSLSRRWAAGLLGGGGVLVLLACPVFVLLMSGLWPDTVLEWRGAHAQHRIIVYEAVAHNAANRPWLGLGLEAARGLSVDADVLRQHEMSSHKAEIYHPHNSALQLWLEMGVFGALWGCALWVLLVRRASGLMPSLVPVAFATTASLFVVYMVGYSIWQSWLIGLSFFAAMCVMLAARAGPAACKGPGSGA